MLSLKYGGKNYVRFTRDELLAAGVPEPDIQAAESKVRETEISAECRRRIYAAASSETQMNMATATAVISAKTASARSQAEKDTLDGVEAALGWVAAMRANVATLAADPQADHTADAAWPAIPAIASAVAAQF